MNTTVHAKKHFTEVFRNLDKLNTDSKIILSGLSK